MIWPLCIQPPGNLIFFLLGDNGRDILQILFITYNTIT